MACIRTHEEASVYAPLACTYSGAHIQADLQVQVGVLQLKHVRAEMQHYGGNSKVLRQRAACCLPRHEGDSASNHPEHHPALLCGNMGRECGAQVAEARRGVDGLEDEHEHEKEYGKHDVRHWILAHRHRCHQGQAQRARQPNAKVHLPVPWCARWVELTRSLHSSSISRSLVILYCAHTNGSRTSDVVFWASRAHPYTTITLHRSWQTYRRV